MWYFGNTEGGPDLLACIWLSDEKIYDLGWFSIGRFARQAACPDYMGLRVPQPSTQYGVPDREFGTALIPYR